MITYSYNEFEIKKRFYSNSYYTICKDGYPFSALCCRTPAVAKKALDLVYPDKATSKLVRIMDELEVIENELVLTICKCGCKERFLKDTKGKKEFISGHNNTNYYRKISKLWN